MSQKKIEEKRRQQEMDVWDSVIFGSMWRVFLICVLLEIVFAIVWQVTGAGSREDYMRYLLLYPILLQGAILVVMKLIFYFSKEHVNELFLDVIGIILWNLFVVVTVKIFAGISFIGAVLLLPVALVSVYKRKELIKVQVVLTMALYMLHRLWFVPNVEVVIKNEAWEDILIFFGVAMAFAFVEEQVRKSSLELDIQVWKDSLTHLYNHEAFYEELESWMERFESEKEPFSILVADIDNFKKVNDTYGHAYGDEVIRTISRIMERNRGSKDFVARYGGEEFAMIMPRKTGPEAILMADKIRRDFASQRFDAEDGAKSFTISIGVAEYNKPYRTSSSFFEEADKALYQAKASGKNRVCCNK